MQIDTDIIKAAAKLRSITEAKQMRFAVAKALTATAKEVQTEIKKNIRDRMVIRRSWVANSFRLKPATKVNLEAQVYSGFKPMGRHEFGGDKVASRRFVAIPTSLVRRTKTDLVRKSERPAALGDKVRIEKVKGNYYLALKKDRKGAGKNRLRLLYLLVPKAKIKDTLKLNQDGIRISKARFMPNLQAALAYAVATSR